TARSRERCITVCSPKVPAVRSKAKLGNAGASGARKNLHYAGHRVRTVQSALCPSNELEPIRSFQREHTKVESSSRIIYRHIFHDDFVVSRIATAHKK